VTPTAIPEVDPITDGFDYTSLAINSIAVLAAVIAIVIAVRAQGSIARERRRQFELEILRQILTDIEETDLLHEVEFKPGKLRRYQRRLLLLRDPPAFWMSTMSADWYAEVVPESHQKRQSERSARIAELAKALEDAPNNDALREEYNQVAADLRAGGDQMREDLRLRLVNEIEAAIRSRVDARDRWWHAAR
jgi:hypothetical protein